MILDITGQSANINGVMYIVGMKIIVTDGTAYNGLKGNILEIRTDSDMETENKGPDIYCEFDPPETPEKIAEFENTFSELYGEPKTLEDICLGCIIMAPEMITPLGEQELGFDKSQRLELIVNLMITTGAISGQPNITAILNTMTADEFAGLLRRLENTVYIVWQTEDVMKQLKKEYPSLTEDDAREILNFAIDKHDASIGIPWESFDIAAKTLNISKRHKELSEGVKANTPIIIPDDAFDNRSFTVTITAYPLTSNTEEEIISFTSWHESEGKICKSIEPIVYACQEMGITGELVIKILIEKDGTYFDSDESHITLPENSDLSQGNVDEAGNIMCSECLKSIPENLYSNLKPHICLKNGHGDLAIYHNCPYCGGVIEPEESLT